VAALRLAQEPLRLLALKNGHAPWDKDLLFNKFTSPDYSTGRGILRGLQAPLADFIIIKDLRKIGKGSPSAKFGFPFVFHKKILSAWQNLRATSQRLIAQFR